MAGKFPFEWDPEKALENRLRHNVSFHEAATAFRDRLSRTIQDAGHSDDEERFTLIGFSQFGRLLGAAHAERQDRIRLISARLASKRERREHEEG